VKWCGVFNMWVKCQASHITRWTTGASYDFFLSLDYSKKSQGRNLKCQIFIQHFFKIVLYWCLDLIRHNIGTHLKYNKYIFDISIPFCHHLYLCAILKQCFTEFAVSGNVVHHVDMSVRGRIPTCDLIGRLFLGSGLQRILWRIRSSHQYKTILKKCCMNIWYLRFLLCVFF
jgi:hypothetical protein